MTLDEALRVAEEACQRDVLRHGCRSRPEGPCDHCGPLFDAAAALARLRTANLPDLMEAAWGIISNAGGGNWDLETAMWRQAAENWRESYFAARLEEGEGT